MYDRELEFDYCSRRARQEEVAAIQAGCDAAATAHRALARLYAARAMLMLLDPDEDFLPSNPEPDAPSAAEAASIASASALQKVRFGKQPTA